MSTRPYAGQAGRELEGAPAEPADVAWRTNGERRATALSRMLRTSWGAYRSCSAGPGQPTRGEGVVDAGVDGEAHPSPDLIHGHWTMQTTTGATNMASSHKPTLAGE